MKKYNKIAIILTLVVVLIMPTAYATIESLSKEKRVIISYKTYTVSDLDVNTLKNFDIKIIYKHKIIPAITAYLNEGDIEKIKQLASIEDVTEDYVVHAMLHESVPQIGADKVQLTGINGSGVKVCILDTGMNKTHPALPQPIAEYDFHNSDSDATDDNGHGTHVAGIVASQDSYYKGVAPGVSLMIGKVLDETGFGFYSNVIAGIEWCTDNVADVISMSLGAGKSNTTCDTDGLAAASNNAVDQGVVVVASSGNDGFTDKIASPACGSKVIAVGAVDKSDNHAGFSNGGSELDLVAPGVGIVSTIRNGGFSGLSGTSMATPHVSGTVALMLQANSSLTPLEVMSVLRNTAKDLGDVGFDFLYGYGRVDAAKAFAAVADSQAPVANAGNNTSINLGQEINLNGSLSFDIDGSITSYEWDLGDGSSASGAVVTHTYLLPGNYTVTLTVTDNDGLSDQDTAIVEVSSFQQLFFDNFESGNLISNWIETGMLNWNVESPAEKPVPSSFSNLVAHADKCTSNCILTMKDSLNLSNYKSIRLRFKRYVDNDLDNGEYLKVQVSNGGAWLTIFSWAHNSGDDDTWHEVVVARDISTLTVDKFKLRFISKESTDKEDTEIDDVKIEAEHK